MFRNVRKELIAIPAQMSYLTQVRDFIEHIGRKYRYSDKVTNSFKLVIEEACTNIIRHGYRDIKGGEITLKAIIRRQSLTIIIVDQGISYDPRQATTPDLEKYIQIGKKGGLGIFMMRKLMDDVQYNITNSGNELRLTKQREFISQSKPEAWWGDLSMRTRHTIQASAVITVLGLLLFFILYSRVEQSTLEDIIESTRAQTYSLADNSSESLQRGLELELFSLTRYYKNNNPDVIYETFIVDTVGDIISASSTFKALGKYTVPEEASAIEDSLGYFSIHNYTAEDSLDIYDFKAAIQSNPSIRRHQGDRIGWAHIWVPYEFVVARASAAKFNIILIIGIVLLVSYGLSYFLIDRIVAPFHSLADWVEQVGQGTVDQDEIDIDASDELGEIAQAFNAMTGKFREAQVSLIEQQRLQKELQVAQEIQQMLLPSDFPEVRGYELASFYEAAKEVGGDLFDFVEVDADTIGICVADVAGKGVPGSLIMTMIRTALRLEARGNKNPAEVLSRVNHFVTDDMKRGMFVTMFYMVLDSRNRIINYASAGHNPMILYRGSTKQTYYLNPSGFPVGIQLPDITLFDRKIETDSIRLRPDDLLVLYTDGVTEAMNPKRELYRDERFLEAIRGHAQFDVSEFIGNVRDDIKSFTQNYPQNDDITYVAVKEKMMQGEVIYTVQKELFRLIEEDNVKVKDACEQMQVSPYLYRKYKKIKDDVGLEGLKDLLYSEDYIEKKHVSIELKTKLIEVIRNNPEFGPKRISDELNTEKYSNTIMEPSRIYAELVKSKLSTAEKRENFVKRGGKKRIKLPGTPLLTLDGQVILDYESAEKVVAERRGEKVPDQFAPPPVPEEKKEQIARQLTTKKEDEEKAETAAVEEEKAVEETHPETAEAAEETVEETSEAEAETPQVEEESAAEEHTEVVEEEIPAAAEPATPEIEHAEETDEGEEEISLEPREEKPEAEEATEEELTLGEFLSREEEEQAGRSAEEETPAAEAEAEAEEPQEEITLDAVATTEEPPAVDDAAVTTEEKTDEQEVQKEEIEDLFGLDRLREHESSEEKEETATPPHEQAVVPPAVPQETGERPEAPEMKPPDLKLEEKALQMFFQTINDDMVVIHTKINEWERGQLQIEDLAILSLSLKIICTHPLLKKLGSLRQLFLQVKQGIEYLEEASNVMSNAVVTQNAKELLKYIEKENILKNTDGILELINELGIQLQKLKSAVSKGPSENSDLDAIRKKIAQKNLIKNVALLENISKSNRS